MSKNRWIVEAGSNTQKGDLVPPDCGFYSPPVTYHISSSISHLSFVHGYLWYSPTGEFQSFRGKIGSSPRKRFIAFVGKDAKQ